MNKYTLKQVANVVEMEGIGYAVQNYLSPESIEDARLADMWRRAAALLDEIEEYLRPYSDEEGVE